MKRICDTLIEKSNPKVSFMITRLISLGEMLMLLEYASQCSASTCSAPEPAIAPTIAPAISKAIKRILFIVL